MLYIRFVLKDLLYSLKYFYMIETFFKITKLTLKKKHSTRHLSINFNSRSEMKSK